MIKDLKRLGVFDRTVTKEEFNGMVYRLRLLARSIDTLLSDPRLSNPERDFTSHDVEALRQWTSDAHALAVAIKKEHG